MTSGSLEPLKVPLAGRHLIQASAGTGKTYTLAALYLRLVLGHDPRHQQRAPMLPPDILVVTFTEAATKELRDRIRTRLSAAAGCFLGRAEPSAGDAVLAGLLADFPDSAERLKHGEHLQAAADWMDEAAIYTIHGFCHRMLRQHAFDAGNPFELELTDEEARLTRLAIEDYWRENLYPLGPVELAALGLVLKGDGSVAEISLSVFAQRLQRLLGKSRGLDRIPASPPTAALQTAATPWYEALTELRHVVQTRLDDFDAALEKGWADGVLSKGSRPTSVTWRGKLRPGLKDWLAQPQRLLPDLGGVGLDHLRSTQLAEAPRKNQSLPEALVDHPLPLAVDRLLACEASLTAEAAPLYAHASHWVDQRIADSKLQRGLIGFQDMLTRLADALAAPGSGPRLATTIREQFPVALIDEFQDTDALQCGIFRRIYGEAATENNSLFLIGDPKQAIYAFRGADLQTYLDATRDLPQHRHTLDTNFRSSRWMVDAVNALFGKASAAAGPFLHSEIPFHPVRANGRSDAFEVAGQQPQALTLWHLRQQNAEGDAISLSLPDYREQMAEVAAEAIARLLQQAESGEAGFRKDGELTALQPSDIAILVRSGKEAEAIREALRQRGLRSVYLSDRDNVLRTNEAQDLLRWLQAMAEPESERLVRSALGTASLAYGWPTLDALFRTDSRWEAALEQFRDYADCWRRRGILPALRRLIRDHQLAPRLLVRAGGERQLSNILQLAELLQDADAAMDGPAALIRWLDQETQRDDGSPADERILRLESDAALIKVVTIHKSKGLEYPLVFLPFICSFRPDSPSPPVISGHAGKQEVVFSIDDSMKEDAEDRRMKESMRLLYVAVTRASHACWLGMSSVLQKQQKHMTRSDLHLSAIGHHLGFDKGMGADALDGLLHGLAASDPSIVVAPVAPPPSVSSASAAGTTPEMARARRYTATPPNAEHWWIASYSALLEDGPRAWAPGTADEDVLVEESLTPALARTEPDADSLHAFPRGPAAGTVLHNLLEALAGQGFPTTSDAAFSQILRNGLRGQRWRDWSGHVSAWIGSLIGTSLPLGRGTVVRLCDLEPGQFSAELEFMMSVARTSAAAIDAVIRRHTLNGSGRPALGENQLHGMLKGFIDLVVEHQGRYYVIDYKSNDLGPTDAHYHPEALREAVMGKRYDAQYSLYLLALHRLLKARLGDAYDYERHVGGAACLFLRGIHHPGHGMHAECPDRALVEELDELFRGETRHVA